MEGAIHNPHGKPVEELSTIFGFNNGGSSGFYFAQLLADDGMGMGSHICSDEGFMPGDLGTLPGYREDRHEGFRRAYPDGYRMEWVPSTEMAKHEKFQAALKLAKEKYEAAQKESP